MTRVASVLDRATLTRATMQRQWLAERRPGGALGAIEHLVGLQAQEPLEPYVGLWSRVAGFAPAELVDLLQRRTAVRALMMRRTLHLLSAEDCIGLRPIFAPLLRQRMVSVLRNRLSGVDLDRLAELGEPLFAERPRMLNDVARALVHTFSDCPVRDLGDALSSVVPLVQVPPRGLWGATAPALNTTITAWLGERTVECSVDDVVLRYLGAYGPAASADIRAWSGLTGLPEVIKRLRSRLRLYRDERGRELLDLAEAELPDPDLPLPARFVPAFDNVVLGYDDRSRVIDDAYRGLSIAGTRFLLVGGRVAGAWTYAGAADAGITLRIQPFRLLSQVERADVLAEGERLTVFLGSGAAGRVVID